ncbi:MAG: tetratricopeptide repeat protein [Thermoplasmatota archaeon]
MGLKKEEIVLYAIDLLGQVDKEDIRFSKKQLATALDISDKTLDLYLTKLSNKGLIERIKKHFRKDIRDSVSISKKGRTEIDRIKQQVSKEQLTPERHNITTMMPLGTILGRIRDPLERIFFLSLFSRSKRFDLPMYLETIRTSKARNNIVNLIHEMEDGGDTDEIPVVETFFQTCFYGLSNIQNVLEQEGKHQDPGTLLIVAEASFRQGRYNDARMIYEHLLSGKIPITQYHWTIASINIAFLKFKEGSPEEALNELDEIIAVNDNKILNAYTIQMKARVLATSGRDDEALDLYTTALNSFGKFGLPLLQAVTYNNRGIVHFRKKEFEKAEEQWQRCRKLSRKTRTPFVEGCACINLSSIERLRGNFEISAQYLNDFYDFYKDIDDQESLAYLDFNYSLLYLDMKEKEKALEHFKLSETIAYPSPSPMEREERRKMFLECARKNGYDDIEVP